MGEEINIRMFKKDDKGKKEYQGILKNFNNETIKIEDQEKQEIEIERKNISQIKTIYNW